MLLSCDERRQQQRIEYHNLISARKLFFKNLASVISYLSSDSLRYSNLYEHFKPNYRILFSVTGDDSTH